VLVLNVGSSTLKVALFAPGGAERLWEASTQRRGALLEQLQDWLEPLLQPWWPQIQTAGHRLVHGGERFIGPTRMDAAVLQQLEALNPLAPLHNPPALEAIRWLQALPQWACFDAFGFHGLNHQHLAEAAPWGRAARWRRCRTAAASTPPLASPPWRGW